MKKFGIISSALLMAGISAHAQTADLTQFARTKDSLMHIAFYDKDLPAYTKQLGEMKAAYDKLGEKEKAGYTEQVNEEYYYLARTYARNGDKNNALSSLERSKYYDYNEVKNEPDFSSVSKEPRFVAFLTKAQKPRSKYITTLQQEAKYNDAELQQLPAFAYQPASAPELVALKTKYNLDSVAGQADDISRIMNLMKWVHYLIPHDGSKGNPAVKNAASMIAECTKDKRSLNCRGLAIVLNEVFLAEGFKSRYITCLPKDTADNDCHVITMVWSTSLKKWLWMDPTFMAYVMNEKGELLSIEEVRDRLIKNQPLILNRDANRNHGFTQTKEEYLESYMAKNLYKLECPVNSVYDFETHTSGKLRTYIQLLPGTSAPAAIKPADGHGVNEYSLLYTNSPKKFWASPKTDENTSARKHTQADYELIAGKFRTYYNSDGKQNNEDALKSISDFFTADRIARMEQQYGKINSFTYIGMEPGNASEDVALFKVTCEKSVHCMGISIDEENRIGNMRFKTYSNYIDWLLAKSIDKDKKG